MKRSSRLEQIYLQDFLPFLSKSNASLVPPFPSPTKQFPISAVKRGAAPGGRSCGTTGENI